MNQKPTFSRQKRVILLYATDWHRLLRRLRWWNPHLKANSISQGLPTRFPLFWKDCSGWMERNTLLLKRLSDICVFPYPVSLCWYSISNFFLPRETKIWREDGINSIGPGWNMKRSVIISPPAMHSTADTLCKGAWKKISICLKQLSLPLHVVWTGNKIYPQLKIYSQIQQKVE